MRVRDVTSRGKYYYTSLEVTLDDGRTVTVDLSSDDPTPSVYFADEELCDGHYEREATRLVTSAIVIALDANDADLDANLP